MRGYNESCILRYTLVHSDDEQNALRMFFKMPSKAFFCDTLMLKDMPIEVLTLQRFFCEVTQIVGEIWPGA
jgi:hypothetical protein